MNSIIQELKNYQILQEDTIPFNRKGKYKIFNITNRQLLPINNIRRYSDNYYYFKYTGKQSCMYLNEIVIRQVFNIL